MNAIFYQFQKHIGETEKQWNLHLKDHFYVQSHGAVSEFMNLSEYTDGNNLAFKCILSGPCSGYPIKEFFTLKC